MSSRARNGRRTAGPLIGGALGVLATLFLIGCPGFAQESSAGAPQLSPDLDYRKICQLAPEYKPRRDWLAWDDKFDPASADDMLASAELYFAGTSVVPRNRDLARRMMQSLMDNSEKWGAKAEGLLGTWYSDPFNTFYNPALALKLLSDAAGRGDAGAEAKLGSVYFLGRTVAQDLVKAEAYFRKSAAAGVVSSMLGLAQVYTASPAMAPEPNAATAYAQLALSTWYRQVLNGDCTPIWAIGNAFSSPRSVFLDPQRGAAWFAAGARVGDVSSTNALAFAYLNGYGVPFDKQRAIALLKIAASGGKVDSMIAAASLLLEEGTPSAVAEASGILQKALFHSVPSAFDMLADIANGTYGGAQNLPARFSYLVGEAELPDADPDVYLKLGLAYEMGLGTQKKLELAFTTYENAANRGLPDGYLAMYRISSGGESQTPESPRFYLRSAAELGSGEAMAEMAVQMRCGVNAVPDESAAAIWRGRAAAAGHAGTLINEATAALLRGKQGEVAYFRDIRRAARAGDGGAMIMLAGAYRDGVGTAPSQDLGDRWESLALGDPLTRTDALLELSAQSKEEGRSWPALSFMTRAPADDPEIRRRVGELLVSAGMRALGITFLISAAEGGSTSAMLKLAKEAVSPIEGGGKSASEWASQAEAAGNLKATLIHVNSTWNLGVRAELLDRAIAENSCDPEELAQLSKALLVSKFRGDRVRDLLDRAKRLQPGVPSILYALADAVFWLNGRELNEESFALLKRAASQSYAPAMRRLAAYYLDNNVTKKDVTEASRLLYSAALAGDTKAADSLKELVASEGPETAGLKQLPTLPVPVDAVDRALDVLPQLLRSAAIDDPAYLRAEIDWLTSQAKTGSSSAMLKLADSLAQSDQPGADKESAHWLRSAALAGESEAFAKYALVLQLGIGVSKDTEAADYWLSRAAMGLKH